MPHFCLHTNLEKEKIPKDLPSKLAQACAKNLNKPISYCVASVIPDTLMSWGGTGDPCAQATLMSIGNLGVDQNKKISRAFFEIINSELGISKDRMYITFDNKPSSDVGFNGTTFHDLL